MTINGSLNDTWNSLYIMENLFKCSYKFQSCPKWENVFFRAGCPSDAGKNYSSGFPKIELIPVYNTLYNRRQGFKECFSEHFYSLKKKIIFNPVFFCHKEVNIGVLTIGSLDEQKMLLAARKCLSFLANSARSF